MRRLALALLISLAWFAPAHAAIIYPPNTGGSINGNLTVRSGDTIGFSSSATDSTVACDTCLTRSAANVIAFTGSLALGTTPATTGVVRLPNAAYIFARNAANNADVSLIGINVNNAVLLGNASGANVISGSADNDGDLGGAATRWRTGYFGTSLGATGTRIPAVYVGTTGIDTTGPIKFGNSNSTAAVLGAVGTTCPAVTCTAAYTWEKGISADGSVVYFPLWK